MSAEFREPPPRLPEARPLRYLRSVGVGAERMASSADGGLVVHRISPRDAPCPSVLLADARRHERAFVLASGPGDPDLTGWSYGALEAVAEAPDLAEAQRSIAGWAATPRWRGLPPFVGGAVGYVGYDEGWKLQLRPREPRKDPLGMPSSSFALYDAIYARARSSGEGFVLAQPTAAAERRAARILRALRGATRSTRRLAGSLATNLAPAIPPLEHLSRIREALALIAAGEIYQVNLTYPLVGRYRGDPEAAFSRILAAAPPFAAFLRIDEDACLVSASPECLFDLDGRTRAIAVYPIKGTRPRSDDPARDRALAAELTVDEKERAEHLMIVDLLRNDLGRVAEIGSVRVDGLAYVESFPRVHHLTSRIMARLAGKLGAASIMPAIFPGGSITGVPKLRAMEIIDRLEARPRGVYTGAIMCLGADGSARASIAIRTAQIARGEVCFGVGGGIVADSLPDREWEETQIKARALKEALAAGPASGGL
jgi:para-aminobenzoate synthetase component I